MAAKNPKTSLDEIAITLKSLVKQINLRFDAVDKRFDQVDKKFDDVNGKFKEVNKRFDSQEKLFRDWKSELFTKIDTGYAKPIKDLRDETAILNVRTTDLRKRTSKLEKRVFPN